MRLINVHTFELEEFFNDQVPLYAILSHTWGNDEDEVSFRDITEGNSGDGSWPIKFKGCCERAEKDGFTHAWIDTCCIDKTNSVELGEAINSMFRWYRNASVCYVYLSDVTTDDRKQLPPRISSSRWFQRGWTLQELLAPSRLRFFNSQWVDIGSKAQWAGLIETITGISRAFLLGRRPLSEASIAQRSVSPEPQEMISAGIFAPSPASFMNSGHILSLERESKCRTAFGFDRGYVRGNFPLYMSPDGQLFGKLSCGPNTNGVEGQIVGIPLYNESPGEGYYIRPEGRYAQLLPDIETRSHIMTSSQTTTLRDLAEQRSRMRKAAFGKKVATDGVITIHMKTEQDTTEQGMFVVKLAKATALPSVTVNATFELELRAAVFGLERAAKRRDEILLEIEHFNQQRGTALTWDSIRSHHNAIDEEKCVLERIEKSQIEWTKEGYTFARQANSLAETALANGYVPVLEKKSATGDSGQHHENQVPVSTARQKAFIDSLIAFGGWFW
ncbi:heterokaryon incompatibility protein-domain-containing protein [Aspergillus transmontanensis]|uniref:Heterokaryon incompatibility protein-domain-containing protein n=1 Tax=Aspergillus transmontanensis TaxID=1034304 RepID=A0A5N6W8R1_9EURO|nr:heterokaryon incompatibility protein-domain-containing protein [Aspergillus transmontanensis]